MRKPFQYFPAVTTDVIDNAIKNSFFQCGQKRLIKGYILRDRIKSVITISEVDISVDGAVYPCFTIFRKEKCVVKSIVKSLNII